LPPQQEQGKNPKKYMYVMMITVNDAILIYHNIVYPHNKPEGRTRKSTRKAKRVAQLKLKYTQAKENI